MVPEHAEGAWCQGTGAERVLLVKGHSDDGVQRPASLQGKNDFFLQKQVAFGRGWGGGGICDETHLISP